MEGQEYLSVSQAAEMFNMTRTKLYRLLDGGKLKRYANKLDGTLMIKISELREVIASANEVIPVEE